MQKSDVWAVVCYGYDGSYVLDIYENEQEAADLALLCRRWINSFPNMPLFRDWTDTEELFFDFYYELKPHPFCSTAGECGHFRYTLK